MMGIYCLNESQAIARSRDKLRSLQLLSRHDLGVPPTVFNKALNRPKAVEVIR